MSKERPGILYWIMGAWWSSAQDDVEVRSGDAAWVAAVRETVRRGTDDRHLTEETWLALARGVPPSDGVDALSHVVRCADCREVLRAVRALDQAATETLGPRARSTGAFGWRPMLAAAAVLVTLGAGWLARRPAAPVVSMSASSAGPSPGPSAKPSTEPPAEPSPAPRPAPAVVPPVPTRPAWLRATPPAITLYSTGALAVRGSGDTPFPDALGEALVPWRAGRHAAAAGRLDALRATYPDAVEVPFYLGVSWLLSGSPRKAIPPLREALEAAPPSLRPEAAWYLGVALLDDAQPDAARRAFTEACRAGHARACEATRLTATAREGS